jgi:hypothetical protein
MTVADALLINLFCCAAVLSNVQQPKLQLQVMTPAKGVNKAWESA